MFTSAWRSNSRIMWLSSTVSFFRNLRRAGMWKNMFFTIRFVPGVQVAGSWLSNFDSARQMRVPTGSPWRIVRMSIWATAAIDGNASPRNPMVCRPNRSEACDILLVAWRSKAIRASAGDMPHPLSITCIRVRPASLRIMVISSAPASMAFSTSSLMTDAGRCMTSPAAI